MPLPLIPFIYIYMNLVIDVKIKKSFYLFPTSSEKKVKQK